MQNHKYSNITVQEYLAKTKMNFDCVQFYNTSYSKIIQINGNLDNIIYYKKETRAVNLLLCKLLIYKYQINILWTDKYNEIQYQYRVVSGTVTT